jgi:hypothetical protein
MVALPHAEIKPRSTEAPAWRDCDGFEPCPCCNRCDGCLVSERSIACAWTHTHLGRRALAGDGTHYTIYDRNAFRHIPPLEAAVELLANYFFSRTDLVAFAPPWDATACPAEGDDALPHLLRAHLGGEKVHVPWKTARKEGLTRQAGRWRIGTYAPAPDGSTRWLVADFDGGDDHAEPLADPTAVAVTAYRRFWRAGVACYLERSRRCSGWHLWVFFATAISAAKARRLASALLPGGALSRAGACGEIEVFPKCDELGNRRCGSQVWLPWYCAAALGGNIFYLPAENRLIPFIPEAFEAVREMTVDAILAKGGAR